MNIAYIYITLSSAHIEFKQWADRTECWKIYAEQHTE